MDRTGKGRGSISRFLVNGTGSSELNPLLDPERQNQEMTWIKAPSSQAILPRTPSQSRTKFYR